MERYHAIAEASSSREPAPYDDGRYSCYRASVPGCSQQSSFGTQPFDTDPRAGYYADPLGRDRYKEVSNTAGDGISGAYSYTSSYDEANIRRGYGLERGSHSAENYQGGLFDRASAYHRDSPHRYLLSPHMPAVVKDVGSTLGSKSFALGNEGWTSGRYDDNLGSYRKNLDVRSDPYVMGSESLDVSGRRKLDDDLVYSLDVSGRQKLGDDLIYPLRDYSRQSEQPMSIDYSSSSLTGFVRDNRSSYLAARGYDTPTSGLLSSYSSLPNDWERTSGFVPALEDQRWNSIGSLQGIAHERYSLDRVGSAVRFTDRIAYPQVREFDNVSALNREAVDQAKLEVGIKVCEASNLPPKEPIINGNKLVDTQDAVITPLPDVESSKISETGKKRRSRWEPVEENDKTCEDVNKKLKKKTRWSAEKSPTKENTALDIKKEIPLDCAEIVALRARLIVINKMLQSGQVVDGGDAERSPSPEPVFDNFGFRINTREVRAREKLNRERQRIMIRLSDKQADFKIFNGKPSKFSKKIYIPAEKYPDYNFVGLIIGPRGHTQKQMEKQSGSKISIRGKGSAKEGIVVTDAQSDLENLHVLIEADSEDAIKKASRMVETILVPVEDGLNDLKRAQLRELASINGFVQRVNITCFACNQSGHTARACPSLGPLIDSSVLLKGSSEAGSSAVSLMGDALVPNDKSGANLYVSQLPSSVNDAQLWSMFSPFGSLISTKVLTHSTTGMSLGSGIVKFADAADAGQAAALMNGFQMDGKSLVVKFDNF